jgi:hypothetical protein
MKKFLVPLVLMFVSLKSQAADLVHNPMYPYICINNATPFNTQIFIDRAPMTVAPRFNSVLYSNSNQSLLVQVNTRQFVPKNPIWSSQVVYPTNMGCTVDNTVSIGITNTNVLFLY